MINVSRKPHQDKESVRCPYSKAEVNKISCKEQRLLLKKTQRPRWLEQARKISIAYVIPEVADAPDGEMEDHIDMSNKTNMLSLSLLRSSIRVISLPCTRIMTTATFSSIANQVKLDLISKTYEEDNAKKRKEIARTFICEYSLKINLDFNNVYIKPIRSPVVLNGLLGSSFHWQPPSVPSVDMYAYAVQSTLGDDVYHEPSTAFVV